jgi:hypothetical protein
MVNKAHELKNEQGILSEPAKNLGKTLSEETIQKVNVFYEDDEFPWLCPGKEGYVSIKTTDSKRIHEHKRLLLVNLKQLYLEFKAQYLSLKIGLSKCYSLPPPWCVTLECRGTHSLCVCVCVCVCV